MQADINLRMGSGMLSGISSRALPHPTAPTTCGNPRAVSLYRHVDILIIRSRISATFRSAPFLSQYLQLSG